MCTVITHPAVPLALSVWLPPETASMPLLIAGSVCSVIPDLDVVGFSFGIKYEDMLGHRGFTHSLSFAAALAAVTTITVFDDSASALVIFSYLLLSTLSHSMLDAATDGGLGVGFFAPFSNKRYFFPFRPIKVSPIGLGALVSSRGRETLLSEARWVWLPSSACFALGFLCKRVHDAAESGGRFLCE
jgi:inner membrane protein